jgi:Lrp/AsnC family leucine-responsive transcriptional regulator
MKFRQEIVRHACVLECHHIAGPHDYLLKVLSKDTEELENFLSRILKGMDGVMNSNTIICLSTLKEEINV